MNTFACIDIGGTAIKYGIIAEDGRVLEKFETPTEASQGGPALGQKVKGLAMQLQRLDPNIKGIAISSAGVVDTDRAEIIHASDAIPFYRGVNFKALMEEACGIPVEAENDVNCAGLSEYESGSGKGKNSMLMMTIGTGIGGCFIESGKLYHGHCFSACEVGYIPVSGVPYQEIASTSALVQDVAERKNDPVEAWNGKRIFEGLENGDEDCRLALEKMCQHLGEGMAAISFILNPEVIVLGGGIMAREKELRPWIEEAFKQYTLPLIAKNTSIEFAAHQNEAGMRGALVHFLQKHPALKTKN